MTREAEPLPDAAVVPADPALRAIVAYFEGMTPDRLAQLDSVYCPDAEFKDPFQHVRGLPAITAVYRHMYVQLDGPRFVIAAAVRQGEDAFLTWEMRFRMRRYVHGEQAIRGASHLKLAADGRIRLHRDYWDAAEELYEKLPVLGALTRLLKRYVNAGSGAS